LFTAYALVSNESTDQTGTDYMEIFVRGVDDHFDVFEDQLALPSLKEKTRGIDILQALKVVTENKWIKID